MGVCYYVRAGSDELTDHGNFTVSAGVDKNRIVESVSAILEECRKFMTEKLSDAELRKVKDYIIGNMYLGIESSDSVAEFVGMQEILKKEAKKPADLAAKIEKVTAAEVQKIAKDIFQDKNLNLAVIGDVKNEDAIKKVLTFKTA